MDSGGRSRRSIKTPKRFDEEQFQTPSKPSTSVSAIETPEPASKVVFKAQSTPKIKLEPYKTPKIKLEPYKTPKIKLEPYKPKVIDKPIPKEASKSPKEFPKTPKEAPKPPKDIIKQAKETPKLIKDTPKPIKDVTTKPLKETPKMYKETPKPPKETPKPPKDISKPPKLDIKPLSSVEREQLHTGLRQKYKRPRSPPPFATLIPNLVLPFWDARTEAEVHEDDNVKELVHCQCGIADELGLMVQCETCLTWQHAHCLGIEKPEDAPDGYTCDACSDPRLVRESMRYAYDQNWLVKGRMKQFPCDIHEIPKEQIDTLARINQLIDTVLGISRLLHSLRIKSRILREANDDDPELKLFKNPWPANYQHHDGKPFEPTPKQSSGSPAVDNPDPDPEDLAVSDVAEAILLSDMGPLEDVSAILDNTLGPDVQEDSSNDCRTNLRLHIEQTQEFVEKELSHIEKELIELEKSCEGIEKPSLDSLRNDLLTIKQYLGC